MDRLDKTSLLGSLLAVVSGLTLQDWGVILGILFGFATLLINAYYKNREIKLKEKYYQQQIKDLEDEQKR